MISNNLKKRIQQVKLYDALGNQTMLDEDHVREMISQIPKKDLTNPDTTYCDPQCGTGTILLTLADALMDSLKESIPDEIKRLEHIFKNQIFGVDIDNTQILLAQSNFKRAVNDNTFKCNVKVSDCFKVTDTYDYVLSNLDFDTMKDFVPQWRKQCKKLIVTGRANKNCYTDSKIYEMSAYKYLAKTRTETLLCMMVFEPVKKNRDVVIFGDTGYIKVNDPPFLPDSDITAYEYTLEVLAQGFESYDAMYGSYYRTSVELDASGSVPLIFSVGKYDEDFGDVIYARKAVITDSEGVGRHKIVISKNGIHKHQSPVKYAGPKYGTGHNTLWVEINDEAEFDKFLKYYQSEPIVALCRALKATMPANGTTFWERLPRVNNFKKIKEIYAKYYG